MRRIPIQKLLYNPLRIQSHSLPKKYLIYYTIFLSRKQYIKTAFADFFDKGCFLLFCAENSVTGIAQTGQNVTVLIESFIQ